LQIFSPGGCSTPVVKEGAEAQSAHAIIYGATFEEEAIR
jgi:hypothetical protein